MSDLQIARKHVTVDQYGKRCALLTYAHLNAFLKLLKIDELGCVLLLITCYAFSLFLYGRFVESFLYRLIVVQRPTTVSLVYCLVHY